MKALTLTQPWASLVALGHKNVETRSWPTSYRGRLAIHAAKGFPVDARVFAMEEAGFGRVPPNLPLGVVVCTVELIECRPTQDVAIEVDGLERHLGDYTWGRWAWVFAPRSLRVFEPIRCTGALGLWTLPAAVMEAIDAER